MTNKTRRIYAASLAALLLCGCGEETVSHDSSELKPAKSSEKSPASTQAEVTLFVADITKKLGFYY